MEIYFILLLLSIVQSLFGVGILLFGTPLLLGLGVPYQEALLYLLPASAALSWSQVKDYKNVQLDGGYRRRFFFLCLPALLLGMLFTTNFNLNWELRFLVTLMLSLAFIVRTSVYLREKLQHLISLHLNWALIVTGFIHGFSNMGGSILAPMVSSLYKEKTKVLAGISFDYAFMATLQLIVMIFINGESFHFKYQIGAFISLSVRYLIGKRVFAFTTELSYQRLLNGFILANAILLGIHLW